MPRTPEQRSMELKAKVKVLEKQKPFVVNLVNAMRQPVPRIRTKKTLLPLER